MISLDQVQLLEQKVGSAVEKITQLNAENSALRAKCAELQSALDAKSEQFNSFQSDQNKIEEGILSALDRLNTVENTVLESASGENNSSEESVDYSYVSGNDGEQNDPYNNGSQGQF
jgi:FtsZ-binding cell division protein ZapB